MWRILLLGILYKHHKEASDNVSSESPSGIEISHLRKKVTAVSKGEQTACWHAKKLFFFSNKYQNGEEGMQIDGNLYTG